MQIIIQDIRAMESAAASILKRAVEMDKTEQYTMALVLYQEGVQILLDSRKGMFLVLYLTLSINRIANMINAIEHCNSILYIISTIYFYAKALKTLLTSIASISASFHTFMHCFVFTTL